MTKDREWTAERIKALRMRHNLSQKEFSAMVGCRQQTVSEWELGIYVPQNAYSKVLTTLAERLKLKIRTS